MKILVTGGCGFIGSHLTDKLIKKKEEALVIDDFSSGKNKNLNSKAKFYKISTLNPAISRIFKKERPEIVFHFANKVDIKESLNNSLETAKINILATLNLLENCRKFGIKKFIFASSVGIYGKAASLPVKENFSIEPASPYSISKWAIEKYLCFYQKQGLDFVSLRYSNVYGPRQLTNKKGGVTAIFINKILKNKRPVIFGNGKQTRDFLYVDDAVDAAILALKSPSGSIYDVGTNKETSIRGFLELISLKMKRKAKPIFSLLRNGEIINSRVNFLKIKKDLGWQPEYSLEKGLTKTIKWYMAKI